MASEISETERLQNSVNYAVRKYMKLQLDISILLTEHSGLVDIARNIHDRNERQIKPLMEADLLYEDIFWKWSDHGFRYYEAARGLINTAVEKATQLHETLSALKNSLDEGGYRLNFDINFDEEITRWKKFEKDFKDMKTGDLPSFDFSEYIN